MRERLTSLIKVDLEDLRTGPPAFGFRGPDFALLKGMRHPPCPHCSLSVHSSGLRPRVKSDGSYWRKSDRKRVRKFKCLNCLKYFSIASSQVCFRQKKRQINYQLNKFLCSSVSQRRLAKLFCISRTTVARKLEFLSLQAEREFDNQNRSQNLAQVIEFDDLETFEHTKCKPLSVTLAVESSTRRILAFEVSQMPANGHLAKLSVKKYGVRKDMRRQGRAKVFEKLEGLVSPHALIKSDENPHYPQTVKKYFPKAIHQTFKGQRGSIVGQGELKKIRFDPLFSLNHTCAMLRANINRLVRKTWCTTKKPERLRMHIAMYAHYHNSLLIQTKKSGPVLKTCGPKSGYLSAEVTSPRL